MTASQPGPARKIESYAVCRNDREPLVASFEVPGTEWLCMVCGSRYAFFDVGAAAAAPEVDARYEELRARHLAGERP